MATGQEASDMFKQLVAAQQATGEQIETVIRNIKKDSGSRKTTEYYRERISRLDSAWAEFETTDNKIRCLENYPKDHKYFTEKYYNNISDLTTKYRDLLESAMMEQSKKVVADTNQTSTTDKQPTGKTNSGTTTSSSSANAAIRRQNVMMNSLKRVLVLDPTATNMPLKEKLWEQIQNLHFSIWESCHDPLQDGYDLQAYTSLEEMVIKNFKMSPSMVSGQGAHAETQSVLPLPKITIPKFEGDYLKWKTFFDLFSQLVDSQQLPTVQKMWYLKSNIAGEAERLISHLSATAENYDAALKLLQERYDNKRVLVMTLIHQLLDQPSGGSSTTAIKQLHDVTQECLYALQNLGIDTTSWDPILLHLLVKKLDRGTHVLYERSLTNPKELPQVQQFLSFLETRFQSMEAIGQKDTSASKTCAYADTSNQKIRPCAFCQNGAHLLFECQNFRQLSPSERLNFVQKQRLCVNCLRSGHSSKNCRSRSCTTCNKRHNSLLHLEQPTTSSVSTASTNNADESISSISYSREESEAASLATSNTQSRCSYVLLSTAVVKIKTKQSEIECRALLDSGSQVNIVTERLAKRLGISMQPSSVNINGIGTTNTKAQHRINVELHSRINGFSTPLEAFVLPRIISPQPSQFINIEEWTLPKNLVLADPNFNRPDKIDILLGAEHYHQLLAIGQIKLSKQLPTLQNTVFGWIVAGKIQEEYSTNAACGVCSADESLELSIARLWELEDIKSNDKPLSILEKQCEEHFSRHTSKNHDNRFIVKIPFHQSPNALGDSHNIALNRFLSLERRLQRNADVREEYIKFMREYESLGHMTKIPSDAIVSPNYFIPHHCVLRPESSTTKLRVVFDASTKTSTGNSLNDLMHTGPTVQDELFSILLRFRFKRFVFTTDVEKMYRQILISPEDRQFQLIIWREDNTKPITYYKLNTITYGTRAAPYLATKCLQKLAKENTMRYPLASEFLKKNFYVDDGLGGADNLTTAMKLQEELMQIMKEYGFNLRKWCANHPQLLRNIPQGDLEVNLDFESTKADSIKTLGLTWLPKEDNLCIKVNAEFKEEIKQLGRYKELRGACNLTNLSPFLDENGIIRVGGRLDSSSLAYDSKHQILLPYNDPIAKLIFEMIHKDNKHCGAQTLLGIVRQRYWPIKGKIMARATVHRCVICSRAKPVLFNQIMGNLPATRVTPARPFINSGVDYCGPITVHYKLRGKRPHKAYIAVFCCFSTKAVHLELVSDLTTEAFIGALKRFIGRRGHCQNLFCDNATNFVGAKNSLPELTTIIHSSEAQEAITNACNEKGIQFNFIPPRAPHFGGLWEAAVKSAKHLLVRSLGNASLTYEELETLVIEIEAILNSRPISPMSNDPNDIGALTPGHFLIGEPLTAQIDAHAKSTNVGIGTRWKLVSQLKHEFWSRWSRDYLNELQYRNKWQEQSNL